MDLTSLRQRKSAHKIDGRGSIRAQASSQHVIKAFHIAKNRNLIAGSSSTMLKDCNVSSTVVQSAGAAHSRSQFACRNFNLMVLGLLVLLDGIRLDGRTSTQRMESAKKLHRDN